ncbi:sigma 54-interacting transcriptional regulator [Flavitalea antarctica]
MINKKILIVEDELIVANDLRLTLEKAGYIVSGIAASFQEALNIVQIQQPDLVLLDIYLKGKLTGIDLARQLRQSATPFVYLSANSNQQVLEEAKATEPFGFLVKPFRAKDLFVTIEIAFYRHDHSMESKLHKENQLEKHLSFIGLSSDSGKKKLLATAIALQPHIPFDYLAVCRKASDAHPYHGHGSLRIGFEQYQDVGASELATISGLDPKELQTILAASPLEEKAGWYNNDEFETICRNNPLKRLFAKTFQLESGISIPIKRFPAYSYSFSLYSCKSHVYDPGHLLLLQRLQILLLTILDSCFLSDSTIVGGGKESNTEPRSGAIAGFKGIIGNSRQLLNVLDLVTQVAPLNTSVLITGESGTGKERVADCIHGLSPRKLKPFIKVNCAALPASLIESELFGHEKGSFTGATERKAGKFEQADGGTLFLDEVGEMSLDMQVKLLRVLQEKVVDRIGGNGPIKTDVRVIAATNCNLEREVAHGRFRLDLYFRLNVFPVHLPPLRERNEDIQILAIHLAKEFSTRFSKAYNGISREMLDALKTYEWPGNVRELENVLEQTVILNDGKSPLVLKRSLEPIELDTKIPGSSNTINAPKTISEIRRIQSDNEKNHILAVLKQTGGRIRGAGGAAEILNLKPTTLESRISKLGIRKDETFH